MALSIILLAGGDGTRMKSKTPKVLHEIAGKPLLLHVYDAIKPLKANDVYIVYGNHGDILKESLIDHKNIKWIEQKKRLGTGHAVKQVLPKLNKNHQVLILCADVPLIQTETLKHLVESTGKQELGLLTVHVQDPTGLGRIIRDEYYQVQEIVEEKDASEVQKQIDEINAGIYCVNADHLTTWVSKLKSSNAQKEYYLTDIVKMSRKDKVAVNVSEPVNIKEVYGANNRKQLSQLERIYQLWQADKLLAAGVSLLDPNRIDIRGNVQIGSDSVIDINVVFKGDIKIGKNCEIGANCILKDVILQDGVIIKDNSILDGVQVASGAVIGPFARVRPDTKIGKDAKIGNFVEIKAANIGNNSKVSHLSYIGNAELGKEVNIGAGTITCNYDGVNKHKTIIEDKSFIGSNSALVAPVTIGKDAVIGAGSVIRRSAPKGELTLTMNQQKTIKGWEKPTKNK
jgi:bifunctional UDP-N-acetylglucosamine pyrophosphorylase / glucosamine-1-phosphate N-acetyltransferase